MRAIQCGSKIEAMSSEGCTRAGLYAVCQTGCQMEVKVWLQLRQMECKVEVGKGEHRVDEIKVSDQITGFIFRGSTKCLF